MVAACFRALNRRRVSGVKGKSMTDEVQAEVEVQDAEPTLDDIFNGVTADEPEQAEEAEPEEQEASAEAQGDEQPEAEADTTGEDEQDDGPPPSADTKQVPLKALEAERAKRQELEQRLAELEKAETKAEPLPDPLDDSEGFASRLRDDLRKEVAATKIEMAQELMRTLHDDYDQREQQFLDAVKENPELIGKFQQASNPAKFAYETAVRLEKLSKLDNVEQTEAEMRAKIEAELRAKILAEQEATQKQQQAKAQAVADADMPSLARTGSGGMQEAESSLEQILGGADPSVRR